MFVSTCMYFSTKEAEQLCISSAACLKNDHLNYYDDHHRLHHHLLYHYLLHHPFLHHHRYHHNNHHGYHFHYNFSHKTPRQRHLITLINSLNLLQATPLSLLHDQQSVCFPERLWNIVITNHIGLEKIMKPGLRWMSDITLEMWNRLFFSQND